MAVSDRNIRNIVVYAMPKAIGFMTTIAALPILTRVLTPEELGINALAMALPTVFVGLAAMSVSSAAQREYFELREQPERLAAMRSSSQLFLLGLFVTALPAVWLWRATIARVALGNPDLGAVMFAAFLAAFFTEAANFYLLQYQNEERAGIQAAISLLQSVSLSALSVVYAWALGLRALSIPAAAASAAVLATAVGSVTFNRGRWGRPDRRVLLRVLGYGAQTSPRTLIGMVNRFFDKYAIQGFLSTSSVGVYSVGQSVGSGLHQLMVTVWSAFQPSYYRDAFEGGEGSSSAIGRTFTLFAYVSCAPIVVTVLFAGEILSLLAPPSYAAAAAVIAIMGAAQATQTFGMYAGVQFAVTRKPYMLLPIAGLGAATTVVANVVLVPRFGLVGAALALAVMYMVVNTVLTIVGQKLFPIGYEWRRLIPLFVVIAAAAVIGAGAGTRLAPAALLLGVKVVVLGAYALAGIGAGILTRNGLARAARAFGIAAVRRVADGGPDA